MHRLVLAALGFVTIAALGRTEDKDSAERKKMQGTWTVAEQHFNGMKLTKEMIEAAKAELVVKKDQFSVTIGGKLANKGELKLEISKSPKHLDAVIQEGTGKGDTMKGLYTFVGDKWHVIFAQPGTERPKNFDAKKGSNHVLIVYVRKKK